MQELGDNATGLPVGAEKIKGPLLRRQVCFLKTSLSCFTRFCSHGSRLGSPATRYGDASILLGQCDSVQILLTILHKFEQLLFNLHSLIKEALECRCF